MSYSCLPNMKKVINLHNRNIVKVNNLSIRDSNCRNKTKFPFNGYCLEKGIKQRYTNLKKISNLWDLLESHLSRDLISINIC